MPSFKYCATPADARWSQPSRSLFLAQNAGRWLDMMLIFWMATFWKMFNLYRRSHSNIGLKKKRLRDSVESFCS